MGLISVAAVPKRFRPKMALPSHDHFALLHSLGSFDGGQLATRLQPERANLVSLTFERYRRFVTHLDLIFFVIAYIISICSVFFFGSSQNANGIWRDSSSIKTLVG